ncbi:MAG: Protein of unknown function precursor [Bacteroidota bacterium]|jgi:hypothetical protein|nr:Protein of unknown function precursor [Bacteroidota bacterium]
MHKFSLVIKRVNISVLIIFSILTGLNGVAQTSLYSENFGTTTTLPSGWVSSSTSAGWANSTASASTGYTGASGGGNALFNGTGTNGVSHTLTYSNSLSTVGYTGITVLWGGRGTSTFSQTVTFQWSSDGTSWNNVAYTNVTYNATWALVNGGTRISLPVGAEGLSNLRFRFTSTSANNGNFRIDDFSVQGTSSTVATITVSPTTLSGFTYVVGNGPSAEQSFTCSGTTLSSNISISAPADYEISLTSGSGFGNSLSLTPVSGTVSATTVYVRLISGLSVNTYNSEVITASSTGATSKNVTCSGSVTASAASDIINANGEAATISSIINTAGPLTSSQGTQVWQFTIRDGGASNDADNLSSIVTALTFAQGTGNSVGTWNTAIQSVDLFDGTTNVGTATVTSTQVQFTGLNIVVADNTSKTISVRLTLKCGIGSGNTDGEDFVFSLSNANSTFSSTGSGKTSFTAIATANGQNIISVVATQLTFTQQPTSSGMNAIMSPAVVVKATDACGNADAGFSSSVTITSTGTMVGSPITATATSGSATFSTITHSAAGNGFTLTATSGGLSVTSNTFDIYTTTVLGGGDLAIVGICVNIDGCNGTSGGSDEISFVTFEDIAPGTAIDITDNGYERVGCGSNNWGNGEGVIRLTRTTSVITKGTIITFRVVNSTYFSSVSPDANWTISYPVGNSFNLNSNDEQVYMMQGGTWSAGTAGSSNATYTGGTYMFAINTYTAWTCNNNTTDRGALPDALKCFSIMPSTGTVNVKYTGDVTPASQKDWIDRLNSVGNWSASTTCTAYNTLTPNYSGGYSFSILNSGFNSGYWTGASNTDWYDCNNWQNFKVPDSLANVTIDNVTNDPVIGASPALFPNGAICNDLLITSTAGPGVLTMNNALTHFSVKGNITNNGIITSSNGLTDLRSSNAQTISGTGTTTFYNLRINNTNTASVNLLQDVTAANSLIFTNGKISTGSNKFIITNTTAPAISGYSSSRFINGTLRQYIASNTSTYIFPVADGMLSTNYKRADVINNNLTGVTYIDGSVTTVTETAPEDDGTFAGAGQTQSGSALGYIMENAQWELVPDADPSGNDYGVRLYTANTGLSASEDDQFFAVKRPSNSTSYADWVSLDASTTVPVAGAAGRVYNSGLGYAERLGYTSFSKHGIATTVSPLPIELLDFNAKYNNGVVNVFWTTVSETNNDYFTILRSENGIEFHDIGTVDGAGNSTSVLNYSSDDKKPLRGTSYYQLKQTDFDGKISYSRIVPVSFGGGVFEEMIYPNPTADHINILLSAENDQRFNFEVVDLRGITVISRADSYKGEEFSLSLKTLAAGTYILKTTSGDRTIQKLIIKQ